MAVEHATHCPLCSKPVEMPGRYCQHCDMTLNLCPWCGRLHPPWLEKCTYCGSQLNTERKLEPGQEDAVSGVPSDESRSAEGRMARLETGSEDPPQEQIANEEASASERAVITPNEEDELPPDWRFIARESSWIPGGALLFLIYIAAEFSDSGFSAPTWLIVPAWIIGVIAVVWLVIAGIAYLLSPPR
jgi:hypothetical protein